MDCIDDDVDIGKERYIDGNNMIMVRWLNMNRRWNTNDRNRYQ